MMLVLMNEEGGRKERGNMVEVDRGIGCSPRGCLWAVLDDTGGEWRYNFATREIPVTLQKGYCDSQEVYAIEESCIYRVVVEW
jgi:hypothetical protein